MTAALDLRTGLQALGLHLEPSREAALQAHLDLIAKWNRVYNLTAVRDPQEMLTHHLLDSLAVIPSLCRHWSRQRAPTSTPTPTPTPGHHVLDVGAGAGLPGVTLAIALPQELDLRITCVDAVAKKAGFIRQVAAELALPRLTAVHGRIESLSLPPADVITCRAFASLSDIVRLTARHLAPGGVWMALKGQIPEDEIQALPSGIEVFHVEPLTVPGLNAQRCLVWMRPVDGAQKG